MINRFILACICIFHVSIATDSKDESSANIKDICAHNLMSIFTLRKSPPKSTAPDYEHYPTFMNPSSPDLQRMIAQHLARKKALQKKI